MQAIVDRRCDHARRIGHGAEQLGFGHWNARHCFARALNGAPHLAEIGDELIADRQRPAHRRQPLGHVRDVAENVAFDESEAIVAEPGETHDADPTADFTSACLPLRRGLRAISCSID